jgi:hypothetical protein
MHDVLGEVICDLQTTEKDIGYYIAMAIQSGHQTPNVA